MDARKSGRECVVQSAFEKQSFFRKKKGIQEKIYSEKRFRDLFSGKALFGTLALGILFFEKTAFENFVFRENGIRENCFPGECVRENVVESLQRKKERKKKVIK